MIAIRSAVLSIVLAAGAVPGVAQAQVWQTNGSTLYHLDNVAIGTTESFFRLRVDGTANDTSISAYITNASPNARAIVGEANSTTGLNFGMWGLTRSSEPFAAGVLGWATATSGATVGTRGQADSPNGIGVMGYSPSLTGVPRGIWGIVDSANGYAGYFTGGRSYFQGNVGMGTLTPTTALEVAGDVTLSGGTIRNLIVGPDAFNVNVGGNSSMSIVRFSNGTASTFMGSTLGGSVQAYGTSVRGHNNRVWSHYSTVSGGQSNVAGNENLVVDSTTHATVGGGQTNQALGFASTVGGGTSNTAGAVQASVGGGASNLATGNSSTIAGGDSNAASGVRSVIAGGFLNAASNSATFVGGGEANTASGSRAVVVGGQQSLASGQNAFIGGGGFHTASGASSMVVGGSQCSALGNGSFAAGTRAVASGNGSFVWADGCTSASDFGDSAANQFVVRASGGVTFVSNCSSGTAGVTLAPGGGSWSTLSDRNAKVGFAPVDTREVLDAVATMPITTWSYAAQGEGIRHIGPTAQDFAKAFGVGEDERRIATVDADGVALAAIQGLNTVVREQERTIESQKRTIEDLTKRLERLEAALGAK